MIFVLLIVMFSVGMYFRSQGFYDTPRMALEYFQSYFNTIFLHDIVLSNLPHGSMSSMLMGFWKYTEIFSGTIPRESYDLSVALTQIYFPRDWYAYGATQQWPIETDFYLTFVSPIFWFIPVFIYSTLWMILEKRASTGVPFFVFVFGAELVRIMSIFRSGLLTWNIWVLITFYLLIYIVCVKIFRRKADDDKIATMVQSV